LIVITSLGSLFRIVDCSKAFPNPLQQGSANTFWRDLTNQFLILAIKMCRDHIILWKIL